MSRIFPEVFGNEAICRRLGAAIKNASLPHALIISGPAGSGKRTLARTVAAALLCERRGTEADLPCGRCETCRKVREGIFPDLHLIAPEEGKSMIPVARIREIRAEMSLSANEADHRVFIIHEADAMNAAAQNALLVSLEEPPEGVVILLLTDSEESLLTTVRSRCQIVRTELFDEDALCAFLENDEHFTALRARDPARAAVLIESAHGCIGRALALLDGSEMAGILSRRETIDTILRALGERGSAGLYEAMRPLPTGKREELSEILALLGEALRDLILLKKDPGAPLLYYYDRNAATEAADAVGIRRLFRLSEAVTEAIEDLARNANVPVVLSTLLYAVVAR